VSYDELEEVFQQLRNQEQRPLQQVFARRVTHPCPPVLPPPFPFNPYEMTTFDTQFIAPNYETFYHIITNILETLSRDCVYPLFITHSEVTSQISIHTPGGNSIKTDFLDDLEDFLAQFEINDNAYDPNFVPEIDNYGPQGPVAIHVNIYEGDLPGTFICRTRQLSGAREISILREFHTRLLDRMSDMPFA
jgi:hypothetical protein